MRLGIRRKLIGTLILVGLFPLAMSLILVLGGGAAFRLNQIRGSFEDTAAACADDVSSALIHEEVERLEFLSRIPRVIEFVRSTNKQPLPPSENAPLPLRGPEDEALDKRWPSLKETDAEI